MSGRIETSSRAAVKSLALIKKAMRGDLNVNTLAQLLVETSKFRAALCIMFDRLCDVALGPEAKDPAITRLLEEAKRISEKPKVKANPPKPVPDKRLIALGNIIRSLIVNTAEESAKTK